ncbi:hypothetical protein OG885_44105 (plasmid) [Streptomyces sp. NBC_00028]|uniref:hypothetical protein n=1 Tax=Streptomyces sp. NBC_00028 TaxID=2975624 RepID=UPI002F916DB5
MPRGVGGRRPGGGEGFTERGQDVLGQAGRVGGCRGGVDDQASRAKPVRCECGLSEGWVIAGVEEDGECCSYRMT